MTDEALEALGEGDAFELFALRESRAELLDARGDLNALDRASLEGFAVDQGKIL